MIDVATVVPGVQASTDVNIRPGDGNDTVTVMLARTSSMLAAGCDTIDGGGGDDILGFDLTGIGSGDLTMTSPTATSRVIQRGGVDLFTVATQNDGSVLVTAVNAPPTAFGTETVTNIEMINFFVPGQATGGFIGITTPIVAPNLILLGTTGDDVLVGAWAMIRLILSRMRGVSRGWM